MASMEKATSVTGELAKVVTDNQHATTALKALKSSGKGYFYHLVPLTNFGCVKEFAKDSKFVLKFQMDNCPLAFRKKEFDSMSWTECYATENLE
jgi:hypothetical protein